MQNMSSTKTMENPRAPAIFLTSPAASSSYLNKRTTNSAVYFNGSSASALYLSRQNSKENQIKNDHMRQKPRSAIWFTTFLVNRFIQKLKKEKIRPPSAPSGQRRPPSVASFAYDSTTGGGGVWATTPPTPLPQQSITRQLAFGFSNRGSNNDDQDCNSSDQRVNYSFYNSSWTNKLAKVTTIVILCIVCLLVTLKSLKIMS